MAGRFRGLATEEACFTGLCRFRRAAGQRGVPPGLALSMLRRSRRLASNEGRGRASLSATRGGLSPRASAGRRFAADSEQRRAAFGAVALPAGPTVRQCHLARLGDGDLLAADAPALWAGVLYLVGVRLNHLRQAYFGAMCLLCGAPQSLGGSLRRPRAPAIRFGASASRRER